MRRLGSGILLWICLLLAAASAAHAEKRVALLIGNQSYTSEIGRLANPHNDIALLEKALKGLQFEVTLVRDAGLAALHQAVNAYARRVRAAGDKAVGFFYYAGHGAADAGTNYLIPVDVKTAEEGDLWDVSLRLTEITRKLRAEAGNATHFVVFDACRNNLKLRQAGSRALVQSRGFVPVAQESGMLIAYATAEGELASDVGAGAGPYSSVLAEEIVKPGVEAVTMFRNVQLRVKAAIGQEPWIGFSALGRVHLAGLMHDPPKVTPPIQARSQLNEAAEAWQLVRDTQSVAALEAFIHRFGDTFQGDLAKVRLGELKQAEATSKKSDDEARAKANAERERLALLQQEEERRADAKRKAEEGAARRDPALSVKPGSGASFRDCPDCPEMVVVPAGSFMMGSPASEEGRRPDEGPQRKVTIAKAFAVGKYEVTFAEWDRCVARGGCKHSPSGDFGRGRLPVTGVSWNNITQEYLPWLSQRTGKSYRLLTEAEWEYAARGVTSASASTNRYWWGNQASREYANYGKDQCCSMQKEGRDQWEYLAPVGQFPANPFGLYDMHGNVGEVVQDCLTRGYPSAPTDGAAWTTQGCALGVVRGGAWHEDPPRLRSANRGSWLFSEKGRNDTGFRVGRTL